MAPGLYKTRFLATAKTALADTPFQVEPVQALVAERPRAAAVLTQHVRISGGDLADVVRKLEYVFRKTLVC
ncbi:hypothetical protein [Ktedonospora formicarum]|uniref:Uncharacterized protein n=1 Tax=Ktedonospora formicarum TaxID=2778364 RepID=A0A8J3IAD6_9CHLR|nr:hypothetical protein [Ktedonospora formicarum]GHO50356.1 hypothetical protein KSX_85190 [Ktedonospora formicarum]